MRVIVAGAGIGGLSAALSLHAAGIDVAVAELAAFDQAYRSTTLPDVAALNSRPSLTP
jgi:2-polyprenyl-6-methoxyphenol hydroxylase-like FAD-dependent oxidoreductase